MERTMPSSTMSRRSSGSMTTFSASRIWSLVGMPPLWQRPARRTPDRPIGREHRVQHGVDPAVADPLDLQQAALLAEAEPLRDPAAGEVLDAGADLDAVDAPGADRVVDERPHRAGHDPPALLVLREPVADARAAVLPIDAVEADHADRPAVALDHGLEPVVVADLAPGSTDEGERRVAVVPGRPRHPARE